MYTYGNVQWTVRSCIRKFQTYKRSDSDRRFKLGVISCYSQLFIDIISLLVVFIYL